MDLLFEIIIELFFEGSIEIVSNKKINKWIRYPILILLTLSIIIVIIGILILGIYSFKENIVISIILIICSILLTIGSIIKFKNIYNERK